MKNISTIVTLFIAGSMIVAAFLITRPDDISFEETPEEAPEISGVILSSEELLGSFDLRDWVHTELNVAGNMDAPVTLVQYSDYACSFCVKFWEEVLPEIKKSFIDTGLVRYMYIDFSVHGGERASEAVWCASDQGAFWQYHDAIYSRYEEDRQRWSLPELHEGYSKALGLKVNDLLRCFESRKYKNQVESATKEILNSGFFAAPVFMINDKVIPGFWEFEFFEDIIQSELQEIFSEE